ncbi:MAG: hypothetical protein ACI9TH_003700 [Kiritimatiellia bacterium]|jgi:hypothetical protein
MPMIHKFLLILGLALLGSYLAAEEPFMKYPIEMQVERKILDDPETGHKNLQFYISVTNKHGVIDLPDLDLTILATGHYDGSPNVLLKDTRQYKVLDRMLLNQQSKITLPSRTKLYLKSEILKSGIGNPNHINFGVWYNGYVVALQDSHGNVIASSYSARRLYGRFKDLKAIPANSDFPKKHGLTLE